jgi:hypothetical protein
MQAVGQVATCAELEELVLLAVLGMKTVVAQKEPSFEVVSALSAAP